MGVRLHVTRRGCSIIRQVYSGVLKRLRSPMVTSKLLWRIHVDDLRKIQARVTIDNIYIIKIKIHSSCEIEDFVVYRKINTTVPFAALVLHGNQKLIPGSNLNVKTTPRIFCSHLPHT